MKHRKKCIRIVLADDHEIFREGFRILLKNHSGIKLVADAENGKQLLDIAGRMSPDIAILDIQMPVMDGVETCRQLGIHHPEMKVIALSMFNEENLILDMLEAGAKGYLLKNTNQKELVQAVKRVFEGHTYYCNATSAKLTKIIAEKNFDPHHPSHAQHFNTREMDIIDLICKQYTSKEIAKKLGLSCRTVEWYKVHIQEKTGSINSVGIAVYAIKNKLYQP